MIRPSTFSIVAFDPAETAWGIAVASKFPAVGAVVPWAAAGAGAVATQSYANTAYGSQGLRWMGSGMSARRVLEQLLARDPQRDLRQVGLVDALGEAVTYTGPGCFDWAGGVTGPGFAAQGNILAGAQVVQAMADTFKSTSGKLPQRLYRALQAGDQAGGDRRGRQSAAILVVKPQGGYGGMNDRWFDYRVDDHDAPIVRLGELLNLHELYFGKSLPSDRVQLTGDTLRQAQALLQRLNYYAGDIHGSYDEATQAALNAFLGNENFEERSNVPEGWIDRPVWEFILQRFGGQG